MGMQWAVGGILLILGILAFYHSEKFERVIEPEPPNKEPLPIVPTPKNPVSNAPQASMSQPGPGARLSQLEGRKLLGVHYALANELRLSEAEWLPKVHSVDMGIFLHFEGGIWLNWVWQEEHGGIYTLSISQENEGLKLVDGYTLLVDASHLAGWQPLLNQPVRRLENEITSGLVGQALTDLRLWFNHHRVSICASEEYDIEDWTALQRLPRIPDWSYVIFDEQTALALGR